MDGSFDIIVVGGGTAGVVAAIQCGRAGDADPAGRKKTDFLAGP